MKLRVWWPFAPKTPQAPVLIEEAEVLAQLPAIARQEGISC